MIPSRRLETLPNVEQDKRPDNFWSHHEKEMRKARLLQAAATIFSNTVLSEDKSVEVALYLEQRVDKQLGE